MARNAPVSLNTADRPGDTDTARPGETGAERDDRNLLELLQELRVAGLGVQVLFGFMLSLPFTTRFVKLSQPQRDLYLASLLLAAISTALLMGPVAYHRLVFRRHQKEVLVKDANVMALCGLAAVGLAISAAVLLVVSYVDRGPLAVIVTVFVVCLFAGLWFALPLARRRSVPAVNRGKTGLTGRLGVAAGMAVNVNETEAKYDAPAGAALPRLDELPQVASTSGPDEEQLEAEY